MSILTNIRRFLYNMFGRRTAYVGDAETVYTGTSAESDNVGKLTPQVIRQRDGVTEIKNNSMARVLGLRPGAHISTYDLLYKLGSDLVYKSNAFAVCFYSDDMTELQAIEPVTVRQHKIFEMNGELFFEFIWEYDGKHYVIPYQFVIHIKSRYKDKRYFGTPPDAELRSSLEMLDTTYAGIKKLISNSASLRGYLKYNNLIDDEEMKQKVQEFKEAYYNADNSGGIAGIDNAYEFHELSTKIPELPISQVEFNRDNLYRFYNVNEQILTSHYTESEWNAFYEAVIEPIALQLSLECTFKLLTERERAHGNKIIFSTDRLQYATLTTRKVIADGMFDKGIITINEYRRIMYLPEIEDGDVRMVSLNYVKADDQTAYQLGKGGDEG